MNAAICRIMEAVANRLLSGGALDRVAIALSGLCVVHCVGSALLLAVMASFGGLLLNPIVHELGLFMAIGIGVVALGHGIVTHGYMMPSAIGGLGLGVMAGAGTLPHGIGEMACTMLGVGLLALGHDLNQRATR